MVDIAGRKVNNWYVVGGVVGAGFVIYLWKKNINGAAASSSGTASTIDPVTGLPYSQDNQIDPLTGMTYLAEAQEYGSVSAAESAMSSANGLYSSQGYAGNGYVGTAGYPTSNVLGTGSVTSTNYATNAAWAQAVTAGLTALGYSSTDVSTALGLYFQDQPLGTLSDGASAYSIVQAAVAEYGPPPVGSYSIVPQNTNSTPPPNQTPAPTTYTVKSGDTLGSIAQKLGVNEWALYDLNEGIIGSNPNLIYPGQVFQIPPAGAQGVPPSSQTSTVPNVVGMWAENAQPACAAAGLKSTLSGPPFQTGTSAVRIITAQSPPPGSKVARGTNCTLTYRVQQ